MPLMAWVVAGFGLGLVLAEVAVRLHDARLRRARRDLDAQGRNRLGL
jgi:hypothetical protein